MSKNRCNRILPPKEITRDQVAECRFCKHLSAKGSWCCLFGLWVLEPERKRIIIPNKKIRPPPIYKQATSFAKASARQIAAGNSKRSADEVAKIMQICKTCPGGFFMPAAARCRFCGCRMKKKIPWQTTSCPAGFW